MSKCINNACGSHTMDALLPREDADACDSMMNFVKKEPGGKRPQMTSLHSYQTPRIRLMCGNMAQPLRELERGLVRVTKISPNELCWPACDHRAVHFKLDVRRTSVRPADRKDIHQHLHFLASCLLPWRRLPPQL